MGFLTPSPIPPAMSRVARVLTVLVIAMIAAIALGPLARATHWIPDTQVLVSPSATKGSRTVTFTVTVVNGGPSTMTVCSVDITYQWDSNTWRIFTGSQNISSGGSHSWSHSEAVPALQPDFYSQTVTVSAMAAGDLLCTSNDWGGTVEILANRVPQAAFTYTPAEIDTTTEVRFVDGSADPDNDPITWRWEFGDGSTSNLQNPTHRFLSAGVFRVNLTVTDSDGGTNSVAQNLLVVAPPVGGGPRIVGLGIAEWAIVAAIVAVAAVLVVRFIKKKRNPRRWGQGPAAAPPPAKKGR